MLDRARVKGQAIRASSSESQPSGQPYQASRQDPDPLVVRHLRPQPQGPEKVTWGAAASPRLVVLNHIVCRGPYRPSYVHPPPGLLRCFTLIDFTRAPALRGPKPRRIKLQYSPKTPFRSIKGLQNHPTSVPKPRAHRYSLFHHAMAMLGCFRVAPKVQYRNPKQQV
ncbi:uncharacterized protein YALI1_C16688g [Yarrowia lipolytica]|uniref:Uncharacterized protein n=1 Tax=Yarrowia lipolytica TaxID=4952 RepID=A0A1D8NAS2_YARLL|nr:hypothetical protein YALI1_C16688g [Yarrowia lipolytica]